MLAKYCPFLNSTKLKNKRLLIIAYYWPPFSGVAGHRWLHMTNYLEKIGYEVHVLIPDQAGYSTTDRNLNEFVSPSIKVTKTKNFEIRNILSKFRKYEDSSKLDSLFSKEKKSLSMIEKALLWTRGNIFIPDARITWYLRSRKCVRNYITDNNINVLITTGTPHSVHLFGLFVLRKQKIKWIADFRDPWTTIEYHDEMFLSSFAKKKHLKLEHEVLVNADAVTTVSKSWAQDFKRIGANNVNVVLNGYEEEAFKDVHARTFDNFVICHSGTLNDDRIPENLLKVISLLKEKNRTIELHLYGNVCVQMEGLIRQYALEEEVKVFKPVEHSKILEIMQQCTMLLLLINKNEKNSQGRIPAKLFEYIRSRKPILLIGDTAGDAADILEEESLGQGFEYSDENSLFEFLLKKYDQRLNMEEERIDVDYAKFSREAMSNKFSEVIQTI